MKTAIPSPSKQADVYAALSAMRHRELTAGQVAEWCCLSLTDTKGALTWLCNRGYAGKRTDPAKPTSHLYWFQAVAS